jgi:DNA-binding CsgD family transcriptional regulator
VSENTAVMDWPLVGREAELGDVFEQLDRDPPVAVVIAGVAGVGKSRLAREIAGRAVMRGWPTDMVVGTRAAASIPFGAVAPLIAEEVDKASPVELLTRARRALTAPGETAKHLLVVDDAQRLDPGTATLIHQVVVERICRTVVTVRAGEPTPDEVETLWTGGLAERRELEGLSREQTGELLAAALGGPVDRATVHRLWQATRGNVLYLRELVLGASAAGSLREVGGVWRLRGSAGMPPRLLDLIERRLETLDRDARAALDVVAFAERIELDQVCELVDNEALERLEKEGFVEVIDEGGQPLVVLTHPVYGDAVRATMPVLRRRRLCGAIADKIEAAGMTRPGDVVRVAAWRLDAGSPVNPELLTTAARRAYLANDFEVAERLATAARAAGVGVAAGLVLAESALFAGRHEDAATLLADLATEASTDEELADVADSRAIVLGLYLGRERDALAVLDEAMAVVNEPALVESLRASLAKVLTQAPRPAAVIEAVRPLLDRPDSPAFYRAMYAASLAMALAGQLEEAVAVGWMGHDAHAHLDVAVRYLPETQFVGPVLALLGSGRFDDGIELVTRGYDAAVAAHDVPMQAFFALLTGLAELHRGRMATAGRHFRESAAAYREINDVVALRWALGGSAIAAGMRSARAESAARVAEIDALDPSSAQLFELDFVERGRAWATAADGATTEAIAVLRAAAEQAAATGQFVVEALLRHDVARLGGAGPEHTRLVKLGEVIDGELIGALAEHACALASRAAAPLEAAARRLAELGAALIAYEAATDAAEAWRTEGYRRRAATCEELARRVAAECEGAQSPAARPEGVYVSLTAREQEVAVFAANGLTSREIASKLCLSRRTVENYLQRIYDKLGVSSRQDLAAALKR